MSRIDFCLLEVRFWGWLHMRFTWLNDESLSFVGLRLELIHDDSLQLSQLTTSTLLSYQCRHCCRFLWDSANLLLNRFRLIMLTGFLREELLLSIVMSLKQSTSDVSFPWFNECLIMLAGFLREELLLGIVMSFTERDQGLKRSFSWWTTTHFWYYRKYDCSRKE